MRSPAGGSGARMRRTTAPRIRGCVRSWRGKTWPISTRLRRSWPSRSSRGSGYSRGGRHVEAGYALAKGKYLVLVGPRENVFYSLPHWHVLPDVDALIESVASGAPFAAD